MHLKIYCGFNGLQYHHPPEADASIAKVLCFIDLSTLPAFVATGYHEVLMDKSG